MEKRDQQFNQTLRNLKNIPKQWNILKSNAVMVKKSASQWQQWQTWTADSLREREWIRQLGFHGYLKVKKRVKKRRNLHWGRRWWLVEDGTRRWRRRRWERQHRREGWRWREREQWVIGREARAVVREGCEGKSGRGDMKACGGANSRRERVLTVVREREQRRVTRVTQGECDSICEL